MKTQIWPLAHDCRHVTTFLRENVAVQKDSWGLKFYPCSAILQDETCLPCICVYSLREAANHRRLMCTKRGLAEQLDSPYFWIPPRNQVSVDRIKSVTKSRFALPEKIYSGFCAMGEIAMSWDQCNAEMKDGSELILGSSGVSPFYDFPEPYAGEDVMAIRSGDRNQKVQVLGRMGFDVFVTWPEEETSD